MTPRQRDPRFAEAVAITEAITGLKMTEAGGDEVRVVLPMDAWDELEYLAADDTEEPTDLASVLLMAWEKEHGRFPGDDDVSCEGEEEGEEWAFYVHGFEVQELLQVVVDAIPDGWTAALVPVPDDVLSAAQVAITRR